MACNGGSIIEIRKEAGRWRVVEGSPYARRITALDTEMASRVPAAGHERLKTSADPPGTRVIGTVNNCAGGITPWGTYLMAEENFHGYFRAAWRATRSRSNYARYGIPGGRYPGAGSTGASTSTPSPTRPTASAGSSRWIPWTPPPPRSSARRSGASSTRGPSPSSTGRPPGALLRGRPALRVPLPLRHRGPGSTRKNRAANRDLLDGGTLSVARFEADGTLTWLPLVHRTGPPDPRERLQLPGRRADRDPPRRHPAGRHPDGPPRGRGAQPGNGRST
jgi:uncharacterized protein